MASDILVTVGADITKFSRAMSTARKDMQTFSGGMSGLASSVSNVGSSLTKFITVPALAAASALAGITLVKGFGRLVGIDTAQAKLKALGHDAESVETIMNSALESVKGTSYGLDEAATAAATAVAAGVKPGQNLTKYLTTAADAAAVAGVNFGEMTSIFGKVQTAQRAYTMELNMLADRGIPIYQWLADEAGTTAEGVRDMAAAGEISSELFFKAIEKNIGGAAKVIGEESFVAALQNIGSDIARIGANFLDAGGEAGGFFSTVKPLLTEFRGYLETLEVSASELGARFGEAFIGMIEKLREMKTWYDGLTPAVQNFVNALAIVGSIVAVTIGPAFLILGKALTFLFTTIPAIVQNFWLVQAVLSALTGPIGLTIAAIGLLAGALVYLWNTNDTVRDALESAWKYIKDVALSVWKEISDFLKPLVDDMAKFIKSVWDTLSKWWFDNHVLIQNTSKKVWEAIKAVIEGVMKFLGPFLKSTWKSIQLAISVVWEAIKAIVSVAISLVLGIIRTTMQIINGDWAGAWSTVKSTVETIWNSIKTFIYNVAVQIWKTIKDKFQDVVNSVGEKMNDVMNKVKEIGKGIVENLSNIDLFQVGKDIIQGLINGIGDAAKAVWNKAKEIGSGIINTIKDTVQTKSPSRLTTQIGEWIGQGLANGISNKQTTVNATSKKMAKAVADIIDGLHKDVSGKTLNHNAEIKKIERRAKEDIKLIHAKAADAERELTQAEKIRIRRITEDSNKKILAEESKAAKAREKIAKDNSKALIEVAEKYVKDKRFNGEMSLKDEGHFWNRMYSAVEYGSEEYERALQNHQNVVKQMRSEMEKTNEDYSNRIVAIDKKLVDDTSKLSDEYNQAFSKRVSALTGFAGLFDEFVESEAVAGQKLISNMQSQVNALTDFTDIIGSLGGRIDNEDLLAELQALGPKSVAELRALNNLSDEELQQFVGLYQTHFELATTQATKELEPLKDNITEQIKALNEASQIELDTVHQEWVQAIQRIVHGTDKEFDSMHQVGIDAIKGLEKGMLGAESSLMATARRIANSISATIASALDIHSPSRVMMRLGEFVGQGLAKGLSDTERLVTKASEALAEAATPDIPALSMAYETPSVGRANVVRSVSENATQDANGGAVPAITNYFTPAESTPSESARKQVQAWRRARLEMGYR